MKPTALCTLLIVLSGGLSWAQTAQLKEAVRENRKDALSLAQGEWSSCAGRCPEVGRLSLLLGTLKLSSGDPEAAATQLASQAAPPNLEAHRLYYWGQALFYSRRYADAVPAFEQAFKAATPAMRRRCQLRLAEAHLAAKKPGRALEIFAKAAKADPDLTPELLFEKALAEQALGRLGDARTDRKKLVLGFPTHPQAEEVFSKLRASLSFPEKLIHAKGVLDAGRAEQALEELKALSPKGRALTDRSSLALLLAQAHFALGQDALAEEALQESKRWPKSLAAEAVFLRARRALKRNDRPAAKVLLAQVANQFPKERPADEALYLLGWVDLQLEDLKEAAEALATFSTRFPWSQKRDEAQWYLTLAHLRAGNFPKAKIAADSLLSLYPRSPLVTQARYWAARARELLHEPATSWSPLYTQVVSEAPASLYAQLAAARLKAAGKTAPTPFPAPPKGVSVEPPPSLQRYRALEEAGLPFDAGEELSFVTATVRPADALSLALALQQLGQFGPAYQVGARHLWAEAFGQKLPQALAVLYPKAYATNVEAAAKANGVDPFLLWAIMRRESAFRPGVQSGADARGLMQLIVPTAKQISILLKRPLEGPEALFEPALNVELASWYVASLVKRFGHPSLVAAAYNAGPKPAARWAEERGTLDLDLFVETIPFKETRGYVKQVVADYYLYHSFYGDPAKQPTFALTLPAPKKEGVDF